MIVTKKELKEFLDSFGELHMIEESPLKVSLNELVEHFDNYILYAKPIDYILKDWEFNELMYMRKNSRNLQWRKSQTDLYPYFIQYKRDSKIETILNP